MIPQGLSRFDMVPGDSLGLLALWADHYWKCLGITEVPYVEDGLLVPPVYYIWKPTEVKP